MVQQIHQEVQVPHFTYPLHTNLIKGIKRAQGFFTENFLERKKAILPSQNYLNISPDQELSSEQKKKHYKRREFTPGQLLFQNILPFLLSTIMEEDSQEAENDILKRFAKVFEQTYTRFLDLQKAENKQISNSISIGKIHARTMAMQKSDELKLTATYCFNK